MKLSFKKTMDYRSEVSVYTPFTIRLFWDNSGQRIRYFPFVLKLNTTKCKMLRNMYLGNIWTYLIYLKTHFNNTGLKMIFLAILKVPNTIRYNILQYYIGIILKYCVIFIAFFSISVYNWRQILKCVTFQISFIIITIDFCY